MKPMPMGRVESRDGRGLFLRRSLAVWRLWDRVEESVPAAMKPMPPDSS